MSRGLARFSRIAIDLCVLAIAYAAAFLIRFDGSPPPVHAVSLFITAPYVVLFEFIVLRWLGIHRFVWRYVGLREAVRIFLACLIAAVGLSVWRLAVGAYGGTTFRRVVIPYGVVAINLALQFLGLMGARVMRRLQGERRESGQRRQGADAEPVRTVLVGAGQAGVLVARELAHRPDLGLHAVAFLDDDVNKIGMVLHGIPVVGATKDMNELCRKLKAEQVLIAIANAPGSAIRRIRRLAEEAGIPAKIIPGLYEIVGGKVNLSRIRNIAIQDLLGREPVDLDLDGIGEQVTGSIVMVTGAGGSIGSELCRQLARFNPTKLVLVERTENNLFQIHRELTASEPKLALEPCLADITDAARIREVFETHRPTVVFHAAAHKHVPMMEWNPREAIKNNVLGTRMVADLSNELGVETFVMISTDKAVNPSSVMGASKRAAEIYVQSLSERGKTRFVTVRFGNVLGSAGSVVPIFQEQIASGGPITVTHPEMRRYFMTIPEACQLVLQAASMGRGGEIFILDMGEPVKIVDLARDLMALSGLREGEDMEIAFTGVRPGEKLFEELSTDSEKADKTRHPKIFVGRIERRPYAEVTTRIDALSEAARLADSEKIFAALRRMVPEYSVPSIPPVAADSAPELASAQVALPGAS